MEAKERAKIISACYDIPENDKEIAGHDEFTKEWVEARKAVDVAIFKAGIREVVETTIYLALANGTVSIKTLFELYPEGRAKLKDWGIK